MAKISFDVELVGLTNSQLNDAESWLNDVLSRVEKYPIKVHVDEIDRIADDEDSD